MTIRGGSALYLAARDIKLLLDGTREGIGSVEEEPEDGQTLLARFYFFDARTFALGTMC